MWVSWLSKKKKWMYRFTEKRKITSTISGNDKNHPNIAINWCKTPSCGPLQSPRISSPTTGEVLNPGWKLSLLIVIDECKSKIVFWIPVEFVVNSGFVKPASTWSCVCAPSPFLLITPEVSQGAIWHPSAGCTGFQLLKFLVSFHGNSPAKHWSIHGFKSPSQCWMKIILSHPAHAGQESSWNQQKSLRNRDPLSAPAGT